MTQHPQEQEQRAREVLAALRERGAELYRKCPCGLCRACKDGDLMLSAAEIIANSERLAPSGDVEQVEASPVDDELNRAFIDGWNARLDHTDFDMALHFWMKAGISALSAPSAGEGAVERMLRGLEWCNDDYALRTPYDGDAGDDGREIITGGDIVLTFADSDEGDKLRIAFLEWLEPTPTTGDTPATREEGGV